MRLLALLKELKVFLCTWNDSPQEPWSDDKHKSLKMAENTLLQIIARIVRFTIIALSHRSKQATKYCPTFPSTVWIYVAVPYRCLIYLLTIVLEWSPLATSQTCGMSILKKIEQDPRRYEHAKPSKTSRRKVRGQSSQKSTNRANSEKQTEQTFLRSSLNLYVIGRKGS